MSKLKIVVDKKEDWQAFYPAKQLSEQEEDLFAAAIDAFSRKIWRKPTARRQYRYDLAILVDHDEQLPPSDAKAIKQFIRAGRQLGIDVSLKAIG